jgi:glycosyltransferase involved in cell wall biosynthesis
MSSIPEIEAKKYEADVALVLEGTYPYVAGGVSSWVHQILQSCPSRTFALFHIAPYPGAYEKPRYQVPENVTVLAEAYCRAADDKKPGKAHLPGLRRSRKAPSRVLRAFGRLHLEDEVDDELLADLASGDLSIQEFLHGDATFELLRRQLYNQVSPDAPFMDFFWHFRAMHVPLLRLLAAPFPKAAIYHAISTGYAGVVGAVASLRSGRPLVVTEHGIYAREREMELSRATWIQDMSGMLGSATPSPLRRFWSHYFRMLSKIAYHRAEKVLTLSEDNRAKQLADGADPAKTSIVPNGVDPGLWQRVAPELTSDAGAAADAITDEQAAGAEGEEAKPKIPARQLRVGFVGRVVPIKDVITLIRAIGIARNEVDLELWMIGPEDEDKAYAARCHALVKTLGLEERVKFLGPQKVSEMYPQLDVVVLTSLSEGQTLVILEAYAAGLPVVATYVGACRELIEGGDAADRALGPSGIVTRVANPAETAAALVTLARDPELRKKMGRAGVARVAQRYQLSQVVASYEQLYASMVTA